MRGRLLCGLLGQRRLRRTSLHKRAFPAAFKFRGYETVVRVDAIILSLCQSRCIACAFNLAFGVCTQGSVDLALGPAGARQGIEFCGSQRGQECVGNSGVHCLGPDMLASGQSGMGAQMVTDILSAALVSDIHLVAAPSAPHDAVQKKVAIAGDTSCLGAHILGPIVTYDATDFLISRPVDIGRIPVFYDDAPLF